MWRLNLDPKNPNPHNQEQHKILETINVIFDLPRLRKTFLWYHASAGFPPKETFIDNVRNRNCATWPKMMVTLINCYFPDLDKTVKGHLKGQRQGICSTKHKALDFFLENKTVRIKIEGKDSPCHHILITKLTKHSSA
jgi:hypothetical protein